MLVWLPGGVTLFNFERPAITSNDHWQVSGWNLEVLKPGGQLFRTRYEGTVLKLDDPRIMVDPKIGFKSPRTSIQFDLFHEGKGPVAEFSHSSLANAVEDRDAECGTYGTSQQFMKCSGTITVEGLKTYSIQGYGWRDHNWGARNWQGFTDHEFLTGNPDDREGFALYRTFDGCGYLFHRGESEVFRIADFQLDTEFAADGIEPISLRGEFALENGERHTLTGVQKGYIPLRDKRGRLLTSIGYSLWEYSFDGRQCLGLGEFLRQSNLSS